MALNIILSKFAKPSFLFLCNPLLDISANVNADFVNKYQLKPNATILGEEGKFTPVVKDIISNYQFKHLPGGSGQNSARITQWLLPKPWSIGFIGSIGKDTEGDLLKNSMLNAKVAALYYHNEKLATGKCVALIHNNKRTLIPLLGASNYYPISHFNKIWRNVTQAKAYFTTGYFLCSNENIINKLSEHTKDTDKMFGFSLSTDYWIYKMPQLYVKYLKYFNFVIGNEVELDALSNICNITTNKSQNDQERINAVKQIARIPTHNNMPRTVVMTGGSKSILVCKYDPMVRLLQRRTWKRHSKMYLHLLLRRI